MKYTSIFHNETGENTWLVYDEGTMNGAVIDPGCKMDDIMEMINI